MGCMSSKKIKWYMKYSNSEEGLSTFRISSQMEQSEHSVITSHIVLREQNSTKNHKNKLSAINDDYAIKKDTTYQITKDTTYQITKDKSYQITKDTTYQISKDTSYQMSSEENMYCRVERV